MESDDDASALEVYRQYLVALARIHLDRRLWRVKDPEDVVQDTLKEAVTNWELLGGFDETRRKAWLRQALLHNILDFFRQQHRHKCDVDLERSLEASWGRLVESLAGPYSTPSQRVARNQELDRLAQALPKLTREQQEAVISHHLHGLKLQEVAEQLGRSLNATAGLIHRGMKRLRELLEGKVHDDTNSDPSRGKPGPGQGPRDVPTGRRSG
jgi:RNA polymerase sigma-70 factor (ECF subfamily)